MTAIWVRLRRRRHPNAGDGRTTRGVRRDAGASVIELVGLTPLVVLLTFGTVQVALWMYEKQLVTAAAQEAAHAAAAADLSPAEARSLGEAAATRFVGGSDAVLVQTITVQRGADAAQASITATGLSMIPGVELRVTGVARSSLERFVGQP